MRNGAESDRLRADAAREGNWKRWGPYLSERQWGTVREDYSADGSAWDHFPHDHARSRAYRWGEDGLLGICDRQCRLCFALALWNGRDPILKERLFGLTGSEGNHGEDVKEAYFYLDSTPTHSYMRALYKYPQAEFPYADLIGENRSRGLDVGEYELADTGVFDESRYFDVTAEYAKAAPEDILIRVTIANRGPDPAPVWLLPTLWFRNTWSWGRTTDGYGIRPRLARAAPREIRAEHPALGAYTLTADHGPGDVSPELLFCENETNSARLFGVDGGMPYPKDAFHRYVTEDRAVAVNPQATGTKGAALYRLLLGPGEERVIRLRLRSDRAPLDGAGDGAHGARDAEGAEPFGPDFEKVFAARRREADEFYASVIPSGATAEEANVMRQGYAGLLWTKQFFHYVVRDWLDGDPAGPAPPDDRRNGRNREWTHLYNRDIISMPDKWEYPWYAAWDLAFHMIPFARVDPWFAKDQLLLFLREWYMHPNGQIPAYEWQLGDVNPPVHAWACWRVYKMTGRRGERDRVFLARTFQKLLLNFTWWVNRKDPDGRNLFAGGFLGLDNIGVFDRSQPLPTGGHLEQADGTAWMAFYCATMLSMALELASEDPAYEDLASKFFEHFIAITDAMNSLGGSGLWDEDDGIYYDALHVAGEEKPLRVRSLVGLLPLIACDVVEEDVIARLPGFQKRRDWFLEHRPELGRHIACMIPHADDRGQVHRLMAVPSRERLVRMLRFMLDPQEFLSPHGIRSVSRVHADRPFTLRVEGQEYRVEYSPAEGTTRLFGGNSNWRGPIWFPINYLIIESLERFHHFYGDTLKVELPTGSGNLVDLQTVARDLWGRLAGIFLPDDAGRRPCHGDDARFAGDPHWKDLVLFYEYFHGDTGRGVGASHQTGWTALAIKCTEDVIRARADGDEARAGVTRTGASAGSRAARAGSRMKSAARGSTKGGKKARPGAGQSRSAGRAAPGGKAGGGTKKAGPGRKAGSAGNAGAGGKSGGRDGAGRKSGGRAGKGNEGREEVR